MDPVQITPEANQDIVKLEQGVDRAEVALAALQESNLSAAQVQQLKALLREVAPTEGADSANTSLSVSEITSVDGHLAVVGKITLNDQQLDTLLSEKPFKKSLADTGAYSFADPDTYAEILGYRIATRAENLAYVESLLAKEDDQSTNEAEIIALEIYRDWAVKDDNGGLGVDGRRVIDPGGWGQGAACLLSGALFVRPSAESK